MIFVMINEFILLRSLLERF